VKFGNYLKTAFLNRWNLLWFGAASVFALLTPIPDALLAVAAAVEITYLGLIGAHPKFQAYVDAQQAKLARAATTVSTQETLQRITQSLPKELLDRFLALKARCQNLQQIAEELKQTSHGDSSAPLEHFQIAGLDRLLWMHLRLLFTQFALYRFLKQTSQEQIKADISRFDDRLKKLGPAAADNQNDRVRKALEDNLQTSRDRLSNLQRAQDNYDMVKLEIDRLENKIQSLSEVAVNRQEPDFISGQVDQVANSMLETEKTMHDLSFVTGLNNVDEAPALLQGEIVRSAKSKVLDS